MTDLFDNYRKTGSKDDPGLSGDSKIPSSLTKESESRYNKISANISSKTNKSPSSASQISASWTKDQSQVHNNQYNIAAMQTTYPHLQPNMYSDPNQYSTQGYSTAYNAYQSAYPSQANAYNTYQEYSQGQPGYISGSVQPGPPGEEYPHNEWAPASAYQGRTQPHHAQQIVEDGEAKNEGVAQELKQQKAQMSKQREEYVRKVVVLRRELDFLRTQKQELLTQHPSDHDNNHILRENSTLQAEIQNKMKTIYNVIEMLTNIIGDSKGAAELEEIYMEDTPKHKKEKSCKPISVEKDDFEAKYFYIYYDPELHWCRVCDVFPKSAKEYLLHLHSKEHLQITQERDMVDTPWHRLPPEPELSSFEGAPKKRMPIKGLQFLISATSWYCKLCDTWVGDLHCASQHLKSLNHNQNYANFVEQNPHWEIEWIRDRDKTLQRISKEKPSGSEESENDKNNKNKKRKDRYSPVDTKKDKRKKKPVKKRRKESSDSSSSSSSSDSSSDDDNNDTSKSIRVSMRNKMKLQAQMIMNEDVGGKWEVLGRLVEEQKRKEAESGNVKEALLPPEDKLINQWMTINEPQDKDKRLFNNLKDRMKQKHEAEKAKLAEIEQKQREKEKQEQELIEKKEKEEKERQEKEAKRLQQEELERLRDKEREQIRFKTKEKNKKRSSSRSPEKSKSRYSRSPDRSRRDRSSDRSHRDSRYRENGRRSSDRRRRSTSRDGRHSSRDRYKSNRDRSSNKKPHFIGRMPLFKNKKQDEKIETKEIKKESYDIPRQSRFQPGNLAKSFIPEPDVVCFPKLSSIPPLTTPRPPAKLVLEPPDTPPHSEEENPGKAEKTANIESDLSTPAEDGNILPPPPLIVPTDDDGLRPDEMMSPDFSMVYTDPSMMDPTMMMQYQYNMDYNNMMYSHMYEYPQEVSTDVPAPPEDIPIEVAAPPPPLPPDDPNDLALLGISADDMAAQTFNV